MSSAVQQRRVTEAVERATEQHGIAEADELISDYEIAVISREARRVPSYVMRRPMPEWPRTRRATFVPYPWQEGDTRHPLHMASTSQFWIRRTHRVAMRLAEQIREAGDSLGLPTLRDWQPTRIGFNYLNGAKWQPALIPEHRDVEDEHGVVLAMNVYSADRNSELRPGRLQFLLCPDTCRDIGIGEADMHSVEARARRIGVTIAQLSV